MGMDTGPVRTDWKSLLKQAKAHETVAPRQYLVVIYGYGYVYIYFGYVCIYIKGRYVSCKYESKQLRLIFRYKTRA